jgi:dipeptidyl aminopeptidase/acylaminoacyl peptidase
VSSAGGQPISVTTLSVADKEVSHRWPEFLPDGRHFLFISEPGNVVSVGSVDSRDVARVAEGDSRALYAAGNLLYVHEDTLVAQPFDITGLVTTGEAIPIAEGVRVNAANGRAAFSVSANGTLVYRTGGNAIPNQIVWFDRTGKELQKVGEPKDYRGMDLSPDGQRIVAHLHDSFVGGAGGGGLWLFDLVRGTESRFTFTAGHDSSPRWSPDGSRIVFSSSRSGEPANLYVKSAGGVSPEELLLKTDSGKAAQSWSNDGKFVVFETYESKSLTDAYLLPMTGDRKPIPILTTPANEGQVEFSPDGRWITYTSDESGEADIYVQPYPPTGRKWLVSIGGGVEPHWRADGDELYYISAAPRRLMVVDVKTTGTMFEAGIPRSLFNVNGIRTNGPGPGVVNGSYAATADGQKFLTTIISAAQESNPFTVVLNWTAGLKK